MKFIKKYFWLASLVFVITVLGCETGSQYKTDMKTVEVGQNLFDMHCGACHTFISSGIGPNLAGVTTKVKYNDLFDYVKSYQDKIRKGDVRAKRLYKEYKTMMPDFSYLSEGDLEAILAYLKTNESISNTVVDFGKPLEDPIRDTIVNSGQALQLELVVKMPATSENEPIARINKMLSIPGTTRTFIHDLNGVLYEMKENTVSSVLEMRDHFENFVDEPGLGSGLGSFAFHPEYMTNGLFYISHTEVPDSLVKADFSFNDSIPKKIRWILTEWKHEHPDETRFVGTKRELLSIDMVTQIHGMQEITFNPNSKKGDEDYAKLYVSVGDGGSAENKYTSLTQDLSKIWGTILRIDPQGNNSKNGHYGIPPNNPFVNTANANGEIWAYGFRNPHRITWDLKNGNMLASEIGHQRIEELNLIKKGRNYGWPKREGTFVIHTETDMKDVYPLDKRDKEDFSYPVLQFDHDEGSAISGGFVYYGEKIPALYGKYVFGTIARGELFTANASELKLGEQTEIKKLNILYQNKPITIEKLAKSKRVDLRLGLDAHGELYIFTKADGKIYSVVDLL